MPKKSGKINELERGICDRARKFREAIKWSQSDFAEELGITVNQLASIEYQRTPLRYVIAWKYRSLFGVSLTALSEEGYPVDSDDMDPWPPPETLDNPLILLSEIFDRLAKDPIDPPIVSDIIRHKEAPPDAPPPHYIHREANLSLIEDELMTAIASVPIGSVGAFRCQISHAIAAHVSEYPPDSEEAIRDRLEELKWYRIRKELSRRLLIKSANNDLTKATTHFSLTDVKPLWPGLKRRVQLATSKIGKKTELAKALKVDLTVISRWLTDKDTAREPGAEYALQMLHWVELQERQK